MSADASFDRAAFDARLTTRRLGRTLVARAEVDSTNDVAWECLAQGLPDGAVVVADRQHAGRGREGRAWHSTPGRGLAMSLALHGGCDRVGLGALPLAAGLAVARALERLGVVVELKWPNDLLAGGRKLAGILCESRRLPGIVAGDGGPRLGDGEPLVVVAGIGVNVAERPEDFPPEIAMRATSLAIEGIDVSREVVAAEVLNAFEPWWDVLTEGGHEQVLDAWRARARFWGQVLRVRTPAGPVDGVARDLDGEGGLVLRLDDGREVTVMAGDVEF